MGPRVRHVGPARRAGLGQGPGRGIRARLPAYKENGKLSPFSLSLSIYHQSIPSPVQHLFATHWTTNKGAGAAVSSLMCLSHSASAHWTKCDANLCHGVMIAGSAAPVRV